MANKIKYGLSQAHAFPIITDEAGETTTYGEGIKLPGSVTLSLSAEGANDPFYADNIVYYQSTSNNGYSGSLELALIPEEFYVKLLGMYKDEETGAILEGAEDKGAEFALAFQFEGDEKAVRHVLYRCKASRPSIEGETKSESITPKTEAFDFSAMARQSDKKIRLKVESGSSLYDNFFNKPAEVTTVKSAVTGA